MQFKQCQNREQMFMTSMSEWVADDSWARIIDMFVDASPMSTFGFAIEKLNNEGKESYNPADLFKLFLYGYRKRIRSANQLAQTSLINMEVVWFLKGL